jgi:hypothetical protein
VEEEDSSVKRKLALGVVVMVLVAGCGGSDGGGGSGGGGGSAGSSAGSVGDQQYVDPFQNSPGGSGCFTKFQVQQQIDRIESRDESSQQKQRAIRAVRHSAC